MAIATGPVLDNFEDAVDALCDGFGDAGLDEGDHGLLVFSQGVDELSHGRKPTEQS